MDTWCIRHREDWVNDRDIIFEVHWPQQHFNLSWLAEGRSNNQREEDWKSSGSPPNAHHHSVHTGDQRRNTGAIISLSGLCVHLVGKSLWQYFLSVFHFFLFISPLFSVCSCLYLPLQETPGFTLHLFTSSAFSLFFFSFPYLSLCCRSSLLSRSVSFCLLLRSFFLLELLLLLLEKITSHELTHLYLDFFLSITFNPQSYPVTMLWLCIKV